MVCLYMSFGCARIVIAAAQQFGLCKTTIDIVPKYTLFAATVFNQFPNFQSNTLLNHFVDLSNFYLVFFFLDVKLKNWLRFLFVH